jgi:hypothetical protein
MGDMYSFTPTQVVAPPPPPPTSPSLADNILDDTLTERPFTPSLLSTAARIALNKEKAAERLRQTKLKEAAAAAHTPTRVPLPPPPVKQPSAWSTHSIAAHNAHSTLTAAAASNQPPKQQQQQPPGSPPRFAQRSYEQRMQAIAADALAQPGPPPAPLTLTEAEVLALVKMKAAAQPFRKPTGFTTAAKEAALARYSAPPPAPAEKRQYEGDTDIYSTRGLIHNEADVAVHDHDIGTAMQDAEADDHLEDPEADEPEATGLLINIPPPLTLPAAASAPRLPPTSPSPSIIQSVIPDATPARVKTERKILPSNIILVPPPPAAVAAAAISTPRPRTRVVPLPPPTSPSPSIIIQAKETTPVRRIKKEGERIPSDTPAARRSREDRAKKKAKLYHNETTLTSSIAIAIPSQAEAKEFHIQSLLTTLPDPRIVSLLKQLLK